MRNIVRLALFGLVGAVTFHATEDTPAVNQDGTLSDAQQSILARVEAALKSGVSWVESHFHSILENVETALGDETPAQDPTPAESAGNVASGAGTDQAVSETPAEAGTVEPAAPAEETPVQTAEGEQHQE